MSDLVAAGEPAHRSDDSVAPVWPHQRLDGPFAGLMETTMSKTNDAEPTRELTEAELDTVSGGWLAFHATTEAINAVAKALATMAQKQ